MPSSIGGPARVKIFAWVMAKSGAEEDCALPAGMPNGASNNVRPRKFRRRRFTAHLPDPHRPAVVLVCLPACSPRFSFLQAFSRLFFSLRPFSLPVSSRRPSFLLPAFFWLFRGDLSFPFRASRARLGPFRG